MQRIAIIFPAAVASFLIAASIAGRLIGAQGRLRSLDVPNHRSSHTEPTPRTGGLGIVLAFLLLLPVLASLLSISPDGVKPLLTIRFWLLILGYLVIAAVGLIDDVKQIGPLPKYLGQFIAALIAILAGVNFLQLEIPLIGRVDFGGWGLGGSFLGMVLTLIWLTGFSNIFNFMDGIDGLAAGSGAIYSLALFVLSFGAGWTEPQIPGGGAGSLILTAACLGFLSRNFPPARIFMGDVGSLFIGYVLAVNALLLTGTSSSQIPIIAILIIFSPFLYDTTLTILLRWRRGEKLHEAHRSHLYQRLIASGQSHRRVTLTYYGLDLVMAGAGITYRSVGDHSRIVVSVICLTILIGFTIYVNWFEERAGRLRTNAAITT